MSALDEAIAELERRGGWDCRLAKVELEWLRGIKERAYDREKAQAAFDASPEELGAAAVAGARRPNCRFCGYAICLCDQQ